MLINPKTGQKILPNSDRGASHYHLMIDPHGTGLHHANLQPDDFGEHQHQAHQITVLFGEVRVMSTWHSDTGNRQQSHVRTGQCYVVPSEQPHGLIVMTVFPKVPIRGSLRSFPLSRRLASHL